MSRTTMNWTTHSSARASHLRRSEVTILSVFLSLEEGRLATYQKSLVFCKSVLHNSKRPRYTGVVSKRYDQYCPIAHALGQVGERWSLLIVRELLQGPKRYTDLAASLPRIGTNILAARLRELEASGLIAKRRLEPPAASQVYELTAYGQGLKPVMRELALWGLQSIDAPGESDELAPGWLHSALDTVFAPVAPPGVFEFRIGTE